MLVLELWNRCRRGRVDNHRVDGSGDCDNIAGDPHFGLLLGYPQGTHFGSHFGLILGLILGTLGSSFWGRMGAHFGTHFGPPWGPDRGGSGG